MRIAVVGAGGHAIAAHLPALRHLASQGRVELAAIASLSHAREAADAFGFARAYDDPARMLDATHPDACLVLVPTPAIPTLTDDLRARGIGALLEKPFAPTLDEARCLVEAADGGPFTMVSANRRFDPALGGAVEWFGQRSLGWTASLARSGRTEPDFVFNTGVHLIDSVTALFGPLTVGAVSGAHSIATSLDGRSGTLAFLPTAGVVSEELTLWGDERSVTVRFGAGWDGWESGVLVARASTESEPAWVRDGTLAETEAFLTAVERGEPSPVPLAEYVESMRVASILNESV